jgi:hypothetical protein
MMFIHILLKIPVFGNLVKNQNGPATVIGTKSQWPLLIRVGRRESRMNESQETGRNLGLAARGRMGFLTYSGRLSHHPLHPNLTLQDFSTYIPGLRSQKAAPHDAAYAWKISEERRERAARRTHPNEGLNGLTRILWYPVEWRTYYITLNMSFRGYWR